MPTMSPFMTALLAHDVEAHVIDFDHCRSGLAVETDYIISVQPKARVGTFESFKLSKTYSDFRSLASHLNKAAEPKTSESRTPERQQAIGLAGAVLHLIDSQKTSYFGKVNLAYVRSLAKQRAQIINAALETILKNVPQTNHSTRTAGSIQPVMAAIESFFLTDHCVEDTAPHSNTFENIRRVLPSLPLPSLPTLIRVKNDSEQPPVPTTVVSPVVPRTRVQRRSVAIRALEENELEQIQLHLGDDNDDDRNKKDILPNYAAPVPTVAFYGSSMIGDMIEHSPAVFLAIFAASVAMLKVVSRTTLTIDTDIFMLLCFSFFCVGLHFPRPAQPEIEAPSKTFKRVERPACAIIKRSMMVKSTATVNAAGQTVLEVSNEDSFIEEENGDGPLIVSPMPLYPPGAEMGEYLNRWSAPSHDLFKVRGPNYFKDKKKVKSEEFLFPARGIDLFLTDACPENIGANNGIMGGHFRDVPSFVVNFRLPWGVLLFYFEIPEKFIPWIRKGHDPDFDATKENLPSLASMTPGDRTLCRFLSGTQQHKDEVWKIVPVVVEGPWIVKQAVGGKPAIVGTKLPVTYIYEPAQGTKAMYFEADLDIVASSAARGILSVVRSYTQTLTLDLGFVVQSMNEDELPEQMMVGCRLHGLDPLHAPPLPPMTNSIMEAMSAHQEGEELTASASMTGR